MQRDQQKHQVGKGFVDLLERTAGPPFQSAGCPGFSLAAIVVRERGAVISICPAVAAARSGDSRSHPVKAVPDSIIRIATTIAAPAGLWPR
ncbi:hypothetical protein ACVDG5_010275 [Mesorhizobium sp. ORM6]